MKVFDCFIFFNELDLLELRFNILDKYVDYFVIVESGITFQGEVKDFYFESNLNRFEKFKHKIIHFKVEKYSLNFTKLPYIAEPQNIDEKILNAIYKDIDSSPHFNKEKEFWWGNDFFQRECIRRALAVAQPAPDDLILISDVDEIPNPETLEGIKKEITPTSLICFNQHEFCYYFNYFHNSEWIGSCCFLYGEFADVSLNSIRFSSKREEGFSPQIKSNGGWHFTSLGNIEIIKKKIRSWSHKELNEKYILDSVEYNITHGYDIFRRSGFGKLKRLPIEHKILPTSLIDFHDKFQHLFGPPIKQENIFQRLFYSVYFIIRSKLKSALRMMDAIF
jgi:beta-1,4-mannosyl-glycoprotein beta-1,4-N-acetylglucosaminyltransferase